MRSFNHIVWNGRSSGDFGIRILDKEIPRPSPGDRHERIQIDGRDGDLFVDLRAIPSVSYPLPIHLLDVSKSDEIVAWLRSNPKGDLELSWDDEYVYKATYLDDHEIVTKLIKLGHAELPFVLQPWKYLKSGQTSVTGTTLNNPTTYPSKPIYTISGTGDVDTLINGELIRLKNMSGAVTIDTEREILTGTEWSNVLTYPFPELKPGANTFSHSITVIPNWRVRL